MSWKFLKPCRHCQGEFMPHRKEQIYCSKSCAGHLKGIAKRGKKLAPREGWVYSRNGVDKNGYIRLYAGLHPYANGRLMIAEHVMVVEAHVGRALLPNECVHHINENKQDNRLENLQLMTKSEHSREHAKEAVAKRTRREDGTFA
jgi:hypothetical protein